MVSMEDYIRGDGSNKKDKQEPDFPLLEKEATSIKRMKTKVNPEVLDWNLGYLCELMVFNI